MAIMFTMPRLVCSLAHLRRQHGTRRRRLFRRGKWRRSPETC